MILRYLIKYMNRQNKIILLILSALIIIGLSLLYFQNSSAVGSLKLDEKSFVKEDDVILPEFKIERIEIESGDTFGEVANRAGISSSEANAMYRSVKDVYDLAKIKTGSFLELFYGFNDQKLKKIVYKINSEKELLILVLDGDSDFLAEIRDIDYDVKVVIKEAEITNSLYVSALEVGMDEKAVITLAEAFQWSIDFAMDPRAGDTFRVIYEERYLDGEYIRPGRVLAARYINNGKPYELYYFEESEDNKGYFDEDGNSVQKIFLKAPVAFKYISSGFTTGLRYIQAFDTYTGHRAIDYAAPLGTPIRSVGDGTITFAGWNGSYGYMVSVRHNGTYSTNYAHMSRMAVKRGDRVKQGQVIGYVGSTGFSTGPHLHYEMVRNGVKINPLTEVLPPGEAIKEENKERFAEKIADWQNILRD